MSDIEISPSAIIRQAQFDDRGNAVNDGYRIVVRWLLTQEKVGNDLTQALLPLVHWQGGAWVAESFDLTLAADTAAGRRYFNPEEGAFNLPVDQPILVQPRLNALLRPPAREVGQGERKLQVAGPSRALRPDDGNGRIWDEGDADAPPRPNGETTFSLSIRDLLFDVDKARARGIQRTALRLAIRRELDVLREAGQAPRAGLMDHWRSENPDALCEQLVDDCMAQRADGMFDAVAVLHALQERKAALAQKVTQGLVTLTEVSALTKLTVMIRALARADLGPGGGIAFMEALEQEEKQRITAREALILSAAHGGRWLVFRPDSGDDPLAGAELDSPSGQAFAHELAGLGWMSPILTKERVDTIAALGRIDLHVRPKGMPLALPLANGTAQADTGRHYIAADQRNYVPGTGRGAIPKPELDRLLRGEISTRPILRPTSASLFLDKVQSSPLGKPPVEPGPRAGDPDRVASEEGRIQYQTPTNDTMVRFRVRPPDPNDDRTQVPGVVLYAQWRGEGASQTDPSPADLRPYAVTLRHSFLTEIYHAFGLDRQDPARGSADPQLLGAVSHPPVAPVVPRLTEAKNDTALRDELRTGDSEVFEEKIDAVTVYDIAFPHDNWITLDLRQGTLPPPFADPARFAAWRRQLGIHWDPDAPVDPALDGSGLARQRPGVTCYRFFATCTDMFGQESAPLEIDCQPAAFDPTGSENLAKGDYRPRLRRELKAPPQADNGQSPILELTNRRFRLACDTPKVDPAGVDSGAPEAIPSEDPNHLQARVVLFRRFIRGTGEQTKPAPVALEDPRMNELKTWQAAQGFEYVSDFTIARPDAIDGMWRAEFGPAGAAGSLQPGDHGYEYRAAVRFERLAQVLGQFFPDLEDRTHHKLVRNAADQWTVATFHQPEIASSGQFAFTPIAAALDSRLAPALPKPEEPVFTTLRQIGTAGAANRDQVLANLLARQVQGDMSVNWPEGEGWREWSGPRYKLTLAQAKVMTKVLEAALERVGATELTAEWQPFAETLVREFARPDDATEAENAFAEPAVETTPAGDPALRHQIIGLRGFVRLSWTCPAPSSAHVAPTEFTISLARTPVTGIATSAEPVWTVRADDPGASRQNGRYSVILPVPGGPSETMAWSVVARSSALGESSPVPLGEIALKPSRVPAPVWHLQVSAPPMGSGSALSGTPGDFLPAAIGAIADDRRRAHAARQAPRLALHWASEGDPGVGVVIAKTAARWAGSEQYGLAASDESLREALAAIAALKPGDYILPGDLGQLDDWLAGKQDASLPKGQEKFLFPWVGKPPIPQTGLAELAGSADARFIDYFHDVIPAKDGGRVMEYSHEYGYQLAAAVDIGESTDPSDDKGRFLLSEFTPPSMPVRPALPAYRLDTGTPLTCGEPEASLVLPHLAFDLVLQDLRPPLALHDQVLVHLRVERLFFEGPVSARRLIHTMPLGRPVVLAASALAEEGRFRSVIDAGEVVRPARGEAATVDYRVIAGLFLQAGDERIPLGERHAEGLNLTIPPPAGEGEVWATKLIQFVIGEALA